MDGVLLQASLGSSGASYGSYTFTAAVTDPTAQLKFYLGGSTTSVYLDQVVVTQD